MLSGPGRLHRPRAWAEVSHQGHLKPQTSCCYMELMVLPRFQPRLRAQKAAHSKNKNKNNYGCSGLCTQIIVFARSRTHHAFQMRVWCACHTPATFSCKMCIFRRAPDVMLWGTFLRDHLDLRCFGFGFRVCQSKWVFPKIEYPFYTTDRIESP